MGKLRTKIPAEKSYPRLYEKAIPLVLAGLAILILVVLALAIGVATGIFGGA